MEDLYILSKKASGAIESPEAQLVCSTSTNYCNRARAQLHLHTYVFFLPPAHHLLSLQALWDECGVHSDSLLAALA